LVPKGVFDVIKRKYPEEVCQTIVELLTKSKEQKTNLNKGTFSTVAVFPLSGLPM
jgi:hypothetical protein